MDKRLAVFTATLLSLFLSSHCVANSYGRTVGHYSVSPVGSAQYEIPIWVPPGVRGVQPHLSLTYDSNSGYGIIGPGWTLGGLSAITRCNLTYAQDGTPEAITLTTADGLCLDGNRLRTTGTGTYQTELANFSQVVASGTQGNGPSYFTVQGKDGLTYEYGNTTDSKIIPPGSSTAYIWAIDKISDRAGNKMTFLYAQASGSYAPIQILYTAPSGSQSFPYQVNFTYSTKSANDALTKYVAGTQVKQTQQLASITVTSQGTNVREYALTYTTSTGTLRAQLTSIQECGGSALTDCLPATAVGYQQGTPGIGSPTVLTGSGSNSGQVFTADVNGDGREDLIFAVTNGLSHNWYVQLASGSGYGAPISTGINAPSFELLIDDFDADGTNELMAPAGGVWTIYKWNGSGFTAHATTTTLAAGNFNYSSADVDGDGLPDLVGASLGSVPGTINWTITRNQTSGGTYSFPSTYSTILTETTDAISTMQLYGNNQLPGSPVRRMDFDGDGRQDLVLQYVVIKNGNVVTHSRALASRGATTPPVLELGLAADTGQTDVLHAVNWNDDACTDLVFDTTIAIAQCNGQLASALTLPNQATAEIAVDWDGDGRTDLLANVGGVWWLYRSQGTQIAPGVSTGISVGNGFWFVTDKNGDGLFDLLYADASSGYALKIGAHSGAGIRPDLATSFTDGFSVQHAPTYMALGQAYAAGKYILASSSYPEVTYSGPLNVVTTTLATDGIGGTYTVDNVYTAARRNLQGRGLEGFQSVQATDSRTGLRGTHSYYTLFPYTGMTQGQSIFNPATSHTVNTSSFTVATETLSSQQNAQRVFPYVSSSTSSDYEVGGTEDGLQIDSTQVTYGTPDAYGNFPTVTTTITDLDPNSLYPNSTWTTAVASSVTPNTSTWCIDLPTQVTVTKSNSIANGGAITRTVQYPNPDYTNCRQTGKITEPNSGLYKVTEGYGYDTFGNIHTDTVTGVGMAARTSTITWTANGQFPQSIQNPLSQSVALTFDPNSGQKLTQTDPNYTSSNPIQTSWTYDNFARQITEIRPDKTSISTVYAPCGSSCVNTNNFMTVTNTVLNNGGSTQSISNTYLDAFDRPLVTSTQMLSGAYDRREIKYDNVGRVAQIGAPATFSGSTQYWTTINYDAISRPSTIVRPESATVSTPQTITLNYLGRTKTVKDANNNITTKIDLVTGDVARSLDPYNFSQTFGYDAEGSLLLVTDSQGSTIFTAHYAYGIDAFQTDVTDIDLDLSTQAGQHRTFTVNALGELTNWTDAKGQSFSATYDALSRPLTRVEPDTSTTWTWGGTASSYNIGQLQSVSSTSSSATTVESYGYDSYTRLASEAITLPGDTTYNYFFTYNTTTGLLDTLKYPTSTGSSPLQLQYSYAYGQLQQVADFNTPSLIYWKGNTANPAGQLTQETLGNGVIINRSFDALTGWINYTQAGVGGGNALANYNYMFDLVGNLSQRQNSTGGLSLTENYYYDNDYRLKTTTLNNTQNLSIGYDVNGNITSRSDVASGATWTYDPNRKHAVTQAGSSAFTYGYDNNGNATTRNGNSVIWTSFNYPATVSSSGGESAEFFYGPNRERWKTIYSGSIGVETTYHVGGLLEKVALGGVLDYRHYIYAGNELVAIASRMSSGSNSVHYLVGDHQSSYASILTSTGTTTVTESFTPFGNRRSGNTWSGAPSTADENAINGVSRRGYTGETALGVSMGLNHLNGRVEDSITGRMLSPDPFIPDPSNTQSFNRYAYVNNNPATLIDPSGFDGEDPGTPGITVTCCSSGGGDSGGGGFFGGFTGGFTPQQQALWNSGLWGVTALPNGDNLNNAPTQSAAEQAKNESGFIVDLPGEWYGVISPDGTWNPAAGGADAFDVDPSKGITTLEVTARASQFVANSRCGVDVDCGGALSRIFRDREFVNRNPGYAFVATIEFGINGALLAENGLNIARLTAEWLRELAANGATEIIASNGTRIAGFTRHGINRAIGDAASRAGTKPQAILDALKNPTKIVEGVDKLGRPFQIFTGKNARVVVNPETGNIVSTNPLSALGAQ